MARLSNRERERHERDMAEAMAAVQRRLATKIADHVRSRAVTAAADMPGEWWDQESAEDEAEAALGPVLRAAALASGTAVLTALARLGYFGSDALDRFVRDRGRAAAADLITTVRADLERRIADAADDAAAALAIDEYAAESRRPWTVAAYEVAAAVTFGALEGGREAEARTEGKVSRKTWVLNASHPEPDECDDLDGLSVMLDDEFPNGDPPIHWGCLCAVDIDLVLEEEPMTATATPATDVERVTFAPEQVALLADACARRGIELDLGGITAAVDGSVTVERGADWHSISLEEGYTTSDGREFAPGSMRTRALPLPLMCLGETSSWGHEKARICGVVTAAERDGDLIVTRGWFDGGPNGTEAQGYVERQVLRHVSVDVEVFDYELVFDDEDDLWDLLWWQADNRRSARRRGPVTLGGDAEALAVSGRQGGRRVSMAPGGNVRAESIYGYVERYTDAALMGVTVVPFPAFPQAVITLADVALPDVAAAAEAEALAQSGTNALLVACAAPDVPPAEWFADPQLDRPTRVRITPEGRVFGHLARWDTPHVGRMGERVFAPRSPLVYERFNKGVSDARAADGSIVEVRTGRIVMGDDHAGRYLSLAEATAFYARACAGVANVHVGVDRFGPWVAGALDPGATPEQVRLFRACGSISGDWRPPPDDPSGELRLCGILVVNEPGFPIDEELVASAGLGSLPAVRPTLTLHGETPAALVAAGILTRRDEVVGMVADLRREMAEMRATVDALAPLARERLAARLAAV